MLFVKQRKQATFFFLAFFYERIFLREDYSLKVCLLSLEIRNRFTHLCNHEVYLKCLTLQ